MNMKDLCREYKEHGSLIETGLHSERISFWAKILGVDLTHLFTCPLPEAHMGSRH